MGLIFMRKQFILRVLLLGLMVAVLASCTTRSWDTRLLEDAVGDALLERAISAIESEDVDALRGLFLPDVASSDEFEEQAELMMATYAGSMISWEKTTQRSDTFRSASGTSATVNATYRVTTDDGVFVVNQIRRELPNGESGLSRFSISREAATLGG